MALAFLEQRMTERIESGARWSVFIPGRTMVRGHTGGPVQNFSASMQKLRCDLRHGIHSPADFVEIQDLFYVVMLTPYEGFRVRMHSDYIATQNNTAVRLVSGSTYQLQRRHTFGGVNFDRDITKPESGTVTVYDSGGVELTPTVDYTAGTFTVASGTPAKWAGRFDIAMTFTDDEWAAELLSGGPSGSPWVVSQSIRLEEL